MLVASRADNWGTPRADSRAASKELTSADLWASRWVVPWAANSACPWADSTAVYWVAQSAGKLAEWTVATKVAN